MSRQIYLTLSVLSLNAIKRFTLEQPIYNQCYQKIRSQQLVLSKCEMFTSFLFDVSEIVYIYSD